MRILQPVVFYKDKLEVESKLLKDIIYIFEHDPIPSKLEFLKKMKTIKDELISVLPNISELNIKNQQTV